MCGDQQGTSAPPAGKPGLSRRGFLQVSAGSAAAVALLPRSARLPLHSPARAVTAGGASAYSMAMHIHSSFSEFNGSMDTHLAQAALNAVDVVWWTDHDWRMEGVNYRDATHFTSFRELGAGGQGVQGSLAVGQRRNRCVSEDVGRNPIHMIVEFGIYGMISAPRSADLQIKRNGRGG